MNLNLTSLPADCLFTPHGSDVPTYARCRVESERLETLTREFDAVDTKGRRFGARVVIGTETRTVDATKNSLTTWDGLKFTACPHAMRAGVGYGASQSTHRFDTIEEARQWADGYFARAEKSALKNKARAV